MALASVSCKLVVEGASGKTETEVVPGQCKRIPHGSKVETVKLDGTSNGGYFKVYQKSNKCRGTGVDTKESMERETYFEAHSNYMFYSNFSSGLSLPFVFALFYLIYTKDLRKLSNIDMNTNNHLQDNQINSNCPDPFQDLCREIKKWNLSSGRVPVSNLVDSMILSHM
ncbi:hypothetical protein K501DRAFT_269800 [Backusella circina FSU 941]|nr:hypothetical protein K501DRAFT_269800 [Backusella circina FSU 941]